MRSAFGVGCGYLTIEQGGAAELRQALDRGPEALSPIEAVATVDAEAAFAVEDDSGAVPTMFQLVNHPGPSGGCAQGWHSWKLARAGSGPGRAPAG